MPHGCIGRIRSRGFGRIASALHLLRDDHARGWTEREGRVELHVGSKRFIRPARTHAYIARELGEYENLMQNPDGEALRKVSDGTDLDEAMKELTQTWRGADYDRSLPWLLVRAPVDAVDAASKGRALPFPTGRLFDLIAKRIPSLSLSKTHKRKLRNLFNNCRDEVNDLLQNEASEHLQAVGPQESWEGYRNLPPFVFATEMSEQSAFLNFYRGYECFLARVVEVQSGTWPKVTSALEKRLAEVFDEDFRDDIWNDPVVKAARDVRDALVHRLGRADRGDP